MDRGGIERCLLSVGYPLLMDPPPAQPRGASDQVLRAIKRWPGRAYGFVYLNPNYLQASLDEFDRCVRDGPMVGVKLLVAKRCNAPELDPIVERAAALMAPIIHHTWLKVGANAPRESSPFDIVELARRHPNASLICGDPGRASELLIRI